MLEKALFPEQVGVDSDVVTSHIKYLESIGMRMDSYVVLRHGKVACECHWTPIDAKVPHDMFSLSKSIVSTAIGIAYDEGIIDLNTKIYPKYFQHKLNQMKDKQREWAEKMTIHDVISMRAGVVTPIIDDKEKNTDWLQAFLDSKITFEPGTDFKYISENAFLLSWIIQKETGLNLTEYLTPRLYEPMGIKVPFWEKNQQDVNAGGWGLMLTAEDLCKLAILYLNKGEYNGKRIFSEEWYNLATTPYTEKTYPVFTDKSEYGYQIWIDHENDDTTYRFTGLYGQFIFMFPDYDAAVVITASDNRDDESIHSLYAHYPKAFIEAKEECNSEKLNTFNKYLDSRRISPDFKNASPRRNIPMEKKINNRMIKLVSPQNLSVLGAVNYFMWRKKIGKLNDLKFNFSADGLEFSFKEKNCGRTVIKAGMKGEYIRNVVRLAETDVVIDAQATWNNDGSLELFICPSGRPQRRRLTFVFNGNTVKVSSKTDPGYGDLAKFNIEFNFAFKVGEKIQSVIDTCAPIFESVYSDPNAYGWFMK
ncbi:MAG: serine hydrolase [Clostridia bacterium]|nr:serine hydrolase [Clostridia bacterium]